MNALLLIHIGAGAIGILTGMIALFARKGASFHARMGTLFFYSMLVMSSTATILAYEGDSRTSFITGLLTFYLVFTARMTATNRSGKNTYFEYGAFLFIAVVLVTGLIWSFEITVIPDHRMTPLEYFLVFHTSIVGLCFVLDLVMIIRGGVSGRQRIARHLGRMTFALWIATGSFFLGQQQFFPEEIRGGFLLSAPVMVVVVMLFFWMVKVWFVSRWSTR